MKIALLTNIISPHQLPLAKALIGRVGGQEAPWGENCGNALDDI